MLVHRAALDRHVAPERGKGFLETSRAIDNDEFRRLQAAIDEIVEERPPSRLALPAHSTFWPSCRTPSARRSEIDVAFLSSRTRTAVPSRMSRMIGSPASDLAFQASQSPFTLRQTRLTVSFPTAPPNKAASARRTRRVLAPAR